MNELETQIANLIDMADSTNIYLSTGLKILFIIVFWRIVNLFLNKLINNIFRLSPKFRMDDKKSNTLSSLMKSIVRYAIYIIMAISILNVLNIPTQSILAAAGLGGLAIGFGAQNLVKDVISGFFILFEDQYAVGDYVTIGTASGTVEDIGLRITKIRAYSGELHIIPNGEVKTVINFSRGNSRAIIDIGIGYEADLNKVVKVLNDVGKSYYENNKDKIVEIPSVLGITGFGDSDVKIRMTVRTEALMQWSVERELRKEIKEAFDRENIQKPYPRRVNINLSDKE